MKSKQFFEALEIFEKEKGIDKEFVLETLETALSSAFRRKYEEARDAEIKLNPAREMVTIYSYKTIVDTVENPEKEVSIDEAKEEKKSYKIGDRVKTEEKTKDYEKVIAQTVKQIVNQKVREREREDILKEVESKADEIITTKVARADARIVYVEMGSSGLEGIMGEYDQIPGETFKSGDRIRVYVKQIKEKQTGAKPIIQVSRSNTGFIKRLFEIEIPEIANGDIIIENIARKAGSRTKIALSSEDPDIDIIGACVGNKGMRINNIISEINGEKIDIVEYNEDPAEFIKNALSPAEVVYTDKTDDSEMTVYVPDNKLSLAIGKFGQNVSLAARLTGHRIDIKPESELDRDKLEEETDITSEIEQEHSKLDDDLEDLDDIF